MMQQANVLILDEPTNHLDLDAKEVLESALIDYPGTILFVSHDRYFIDRIASRIIEIEAGKTTTYLGDYSYFIEKKRETAEREALQNESSSVTKDKTLSELDSTDKRTFQQDKEAKRIERQKERRITSLETEMEQIEAKINQLEEQLTQPDIYSDHEKAQVIQIDIQTKNNALVALMEEWEELHS